MQVDKFFEAARKALGTPGTNEFHNFADMINDAIFTQLQRRGLRVDDYCVTTTICDEGIKLEYEFNDNGRIFTVLIKTGQTMANFVDSKFAPVSIAGLISSL